MTAFALRHLERFEQARRRMALTWEQIWRAEFRICGVWPRF